MTDIELAPLERPRRFHFNLVPAALFTPRKAFDKITSLNGCTWLTPLLILTITAIMLAIASGFLKQQAAAMGQITFPPDYEWWTQEQQAQYMQAMQSMQGPVFIYVFPIIGSLLSVWVGWLLVGGLLHLVLTLFGGRGGTASAMAVVAWAGLPFALRDLVRFVYELAAHKLITSRGVAAFAPADGATLSLFLASLFALLDVYIIWHIALITLGARTAFKLSAGKALAGTLITVLFIIGLQALLGFGMGQVQNLNIVRPFFF